MKFFVCVLLACASAASANYAANIIPVGNAGYGLGYANVASIPLGAGLVDPNQKVINHPPQVFHSKPLLVNHKPIIHNQV